MGRALLVLHNETLRSRAIDWIKRAPKETRVTFQGPKRTLAQNDRMHAMLTEVAVAVPIWGGCKVSKDDWKLIFLDALKREMRLVPNLDRTGLVNLSGRSSSDLSVEEMTGMIELIFAFGAQHGVQFHEPQDRAA